MSIIKRDHTPDYSILHHAAMLADDNRLSAYKTAIRNIVLPTSVVVDIGSGTGILSAYAAQITQSTVYSIEYYKMGYAIAKKILSQGHYPHIQLINQSSYDVQLAIAPDVLITETLGQIGPEENIVEICYDFVCRHPSIQHVIPAKVSIYAECVQSNNAAQWLAQYKQGFRNASFPGFDFDWVESDLDNELSALIFQNDIVDAIPISKRICLVEYVLGHSKTSSFSRSVPIQKSAKNIFVHLYFEAELPNGVKLSSRFTEQNHWKHSFIATRKESRSIEISYQAGSGFVCAQWQS